MSGQLMGSGSCRTQYGELCHKINLQLQGFSLNFSKGVGDPFPSNWGLKWVAGMTLGMFLTFVYSKFKLIYST